jgi:hypothetical protein
MPDQPDIITRARAILREYEEKADCNAFADTALCPCVEMALRIARMEKPQDKPANETKDYYEMDG